jgi:hypothetical protein
LGFGVGLGAGGGGGGGGMGVVGVVGGGGAGSTGSSSSPAYAADEKAMASSALTDAVVYRVLRSMKPPMSGGSRELEHDPS